MQYSACVLTVQYLLWVSAVMRTMSLLQENILPMIPQLLQGLTQKLILVSKVQRTSFFFFSLSLSFIFFF